jgi:hypothetical protein
MLLEVFYGSSGFSRVTMRAVSDVISGRTWITISILEGIAEMHGRISFRSMEDFVIDGISNMVAESCVAAFLPSVFIEVFLLPPPLFGRDRFSIIIGYHRYLIWVIFIWVWEVSATWSAHLERVLKEVEDSKMASMWFGALMKKLKCLKVEAFCRDRAAPLSADLRNQPWHKNRGMTQNATYR